MGLDMYLYAANKKLTQKDIVNVEIAKKEFYENREEGNEERFNYDFELEQIGYWRKHSDLHGRFEEMWKKRVPQEYSNNTDFNCVYLVLSKEDLESLIEEIEIETKHPGSKFDEARGFFWGQSCSEDWQDTLKLFHTTLQQIDFDNETVLYTSWW